MKRKQPPKKPHSWGKRSDEAGNRGIKTWKGRQKIVSSRYSSKRLQRLPDAYCWRHELSPPSFPKVNDLHHQSTHTLSPECQAQHGPHSAAWQVSLHPLTPHLPPVPLLPSGHHSSSIPPEAAQGHPAAIKPSQDRSKPTEVPMSELCWPLLHV